MVFRRLPLRGQARSKGLHTGPNLCAIASQYPSWVAIMYVKESLPNCEQHRNRLRFLLPGKRESCCRGRPRGGFGSVDLRRIEQTGSKKANQKLRSEPLAVEVLYNQAHGEFGFGDEYLNVSGFVQHVIQKNEAGQNLIGFAGVVFEVFKNRP